MYASRPHTLLGETMRGTAAEAPTQQRGDHDCVLSWAGFAKENARVTPYRIDGNHPRDTGGC